MSTASGGGKRKRTRPAEFTVALIGNPNTGKSTLFNRLTGSRQRVGNYPGVTVAKKIGRMQLAGNAITVVDLPGVYSLAASSPDERVACDVLTGRTDCPPRLAVCIADSRHLSRGLFLACQIADFGIPLVIALNFADELAADGIEVDAGVLSCRLGVPVVSISARSGRGLRDLQQALQASLNQPQHLRLPPWPDEVRRSAAHLRQEIATNIRLSDAELRRILFDSNSACLDLVGVPAKDRERLLRNAREPMISDGIDPLTIEPVLLHAHIGKALDHVVRRRMKTPRDLTRTIDDVLTHRVFGLAFFAALMFLIFQCIYSWSTPAMDAIEGVNAALAAGFARLLEPMPVFQSLVCDGIVAGAGGVVVFLPQILLLFFFVALLEDTGYMARAAFLMDRLFGWCGLNGKSFVPLLSGYACAIPGILAARTIEDPKARLVTVLITPLMSCSARLPVYLLMIGAFVQPTWGPVIAAATLFAVHLIGLAVALPLAWFMNRCVLKTPTQPFVIELPRYRIPAAKDVLWRMGLGGWEFLQRAGSIILAISILIWALLYFPHRDGSPGDPAAQAAQVEQSYLGQAGRAIAPVFAPAGFDWRISIGVLASFPAREVLVSTLGIIYGLGSDTPGESEPLTSALRQAKWPDGPRAGQPVFTVATALAIMVFFAFCMQCAATLAIITREVGLRYAVLSFFFMTSLAWVSAVAVYQIASRFLP